MKTYVDFSLFCNDKVKFNYRVHGYLSFTTMPKEGDYIFFDFNKGVVAISPDKVNNEPCLKIEKIILGGGSSTEYLIAVEDWIVDSTEEVPSLLSNLEKKAGLYLDNNLEV